MHCYSRLFWGKGYLSYMRTLIDDQISSWCNYRRYADKWSKGWETRSNRPSERHLYRYRWTTTITTANLLIWSFFCFHRQTVNWFHAYLTICFTIIDCTRVSRGLQMLLPLGNGHVVGHDYLHLAEQRFSHPGFFQQENAAQANRKLSWSVHVNHFPWKSRLIQNYNRHAFLGQKHGHYHISESDICWT